MTSTRLVSITINNYNYARYVGRATESVLAGKALFSGWIARTIHSGETQPLHWCELESWPHGIPSYKLERFLMMALFPIVELVPKRSLRATSAAIPSGATPRLRY